MDETTLNALTALAEKLGTTSEYAVHHGLQLTDNAGGKPQSVAKSD